MHIFIVAIAAAAVVGGAQASWPSEAPFFPKYPTRSLQASGSPQRPLDAPAVQRHLLLLTR